MSLTYFRDLVISGHILSVSIITPDKYGRLKFQLTLGLKPDGNSKEKNQTKFYIISYDTALRDRGWFVTGAFVYCHCRFVVGTLYGLEHCSLVPYDCYRSLVQRINLLDLGLVK